MTYRTRKQQFPGNATITAEFLAVATPAQAALVTADTEWVSNDDDARYGAWRLMVASTVVLYFYRGTPGTVQAVA